MCEAGRTPNQTSPSVQQPNELKIRNMKSGAVAEELSHHGDTVNNESRITSQEPNISEGL